MGIIRTKSKMNEREGKSTLYIKERVQTHASLPAPILRISACFPGGFSWLMWSGRIGRCQYCSLHFKPASSIIRIKFSSFPNKPAVCSPKFEKERGKWGETILWYN